MEGFTAVESAGCLIPSPVVVVGTYKDDGSPNFAAGAWAGTSCSSPQIISVSFREATLTHSLIRARREFTVNLCSAERVAQVDYFGNNSGRDVDKAAHVGFHVKRASQVNAPYCTEFKLVYQCKLVLEKKVGSHTIFYGEVVVVSAAEDVVTANQPDILKIDPLIYSDYTAAYYRCAKEKVGDAFSVYRSVG
uniref:Flavin reductase domain-containing protein n=1 Tax=Coptotermes formosanus TaxID=36987 RepID=R4V3Q2_COPFO|nr:flavin reductase domain-containing protein [Coptotermes formosanus]